MGHNPSLRNGNGRKWESHLRGLYCHCQIKGLSHPRAPETIKATFPPCVTETVLLNVLVILFLLALYPGEQLLGMARTGHGYPVTKHDPNLVQTM